MISVTLDGSEIYRSDVLKPGDCIDGFTLAAPLASGTYDAVVCTEIYADGERVSATCIPVVLIAD